MANKKYINENVSKDSSEKYFDFAKYNADFMKTHYKRITTLIPLSEVEIIDYLSKQKSVSAYILDLIKKDMHKK